MKKGILCQLFGGNSKVRAGSGVPSLPPTNYKRGTERVLAIVAAVDNPSGSMHTGSQITSDVLWCIVGGSTVSAACLHGDARLAGIRPPSAHTFFCCGKQHGQRPTLASEPPNFQRLHPWHVPSAFPTQPQPPPRHTCCSRASFRDLFQSASAKDDDDELDPETDALTDPNTQDSQADRGAARPSVSSTRGNR